MAKKEIKHLKKKLCLNFFSSFLEFEWDLIDAIAGLQVYTACQVNEWVRMWQWLKICHCKQHSIEYSCLVFSAIGFACWFESKKKKRYRCLVIIAIEMNANYCEQECCLTVSVLMADLLIIASSAVA